ncbi:MAG: proton-conducting transporter membrane subunit, partial [Deltaproteobacteria bacterium]|nr:proton-conducting transporter membrane subunit [Deltaproteobacteria bacterium]
LGALIPWLLRGRRWAGTLGFLAGLAASATGGGAALVLLLRHEIVAVAVPWTAPFGALAFGVDPLSSFFLLCIYLVGGLSLLYGRGYFPRARAGAAFAWMNLLIAAMAMVVIARDAIAFLAGWELMFAASWVLVTHEDDEASQAAGFTYLLASQAGVVLILILFGLLARHAGGIGFDAFAAAGAPPGALATICFATALAGFATKAGLWPLHGWLPQAHPAAPSPVSAVMSGVMIKMGIYGLLRTLTFLGPPHAAWGLALIVAGGLSALGGVLLALAQHDLKRLLAYHSVENVGIIALGIGLGILGQAAGAPRVAWAGYAGALLHTLNHGLFKGLLFQAAGAVGHGAGTRDLEKLGGLLRRMPATGALFLVGAVAISGLPPLNGFVSEWLVYLAALREGALDPQKGVAAVAILVVPLLALVGGLAAACFVKVFGVAFLGEPRTSGADGAREATRSMRVAMGLGAAACVAIGVAPAAALRLVAEPAAALAGTPAAAADAALGALHNVSLAAAFLLLATLVLLAARRVLLRGREVGVAPTWDCGYTLTTPRMQYTAASFAAPVLEPFEGLLSVHAEREGPDGYFPVQARVQRHLEDPGEVFVRRALRVLILALSPARALQRGPVQLGLLYVFLTLLALLLWQVSA